MSRHHGQPLGPRRGCRRNRHPLLIVGLIWGCCPGRPGVGRGRSPVAGGRGWQMAPLGVDTLTDGHLARNFGAPLWLLTTVWAVLGCWCRRGGDRGRGQAGGAAAQRRPDALHGHRRRPGTAHPQGPLTPPPRCVHPWPAPPQTAGGGECGITLRAAAPKGRCCASTWEDVLWRSWPPRGQDHRFGGADGARCAGAVVATSNKSDLLATTAAARTDAGRVWVFDPAVDRGVPATVLVEPAGRNQHGSRRQPAGQTVRPRGALRVVVVVGLLGLRG